ncbi:caspase domain-containing protein [Epithele typhae]|uniref:caspase domain-containing protein n=1 Tax=Epithele typhae TaxID=378194 RepID=UPI002007B940|nr:caspase domain-containing protein [Epithele typhae]KAH9923423.1 caspase domain-containing protein [Epithele typhae]
MPGPGFSSGEAFEDQDDATLSTPTHTLVHNATPGGTYHTAWDVQSALTDAELARVEEEREIMPGTFPDGSSLLAFLAGLQQRSPDTTSWSTSSSHSWHTAREAKANLSQALLISINYDRMPYNEEYVPLSRSRQDTKDLRDLLISTYGYDPENIVMMLDEDGIAPNLEPTRANILDQIRKMVANARAGSRYVFFFSGYSGQVATGQPEEEDSFDESLVLIDHRKHIGVDEKTTNERILLDTIFDSYQSGTMLDLDHYLCNSIYSMSQSDVRTVTGKLSQSDNDHGDAAREDSTWGARIYRRRRRVSEDEVGVRGGRSSLGDVAESPSTASLVTSTLIDEEEIDRRCSSPHR